MPHRRHASNNRNDLQNHSTESPPPQADNPPPQDPAVRVTPAGRGNRPQRRKPGIRRNPFPREISPSEVNDRAIQRGSSHRGNPQGKDNLSPNQAMPSRRKSGQQQGQPPAQGSASPRRNPTNKNTSNKNISGRNTQSANPTEIKPRNGNMRTNNSRDNITPGRNAPGNRVSNAPRRGYYVQRSSHSDRINPSVPIRTNKGIKARNQRGQFSQHWWARRWIEAMEGLVDQARLQRGRSYARSGQVLSIVETQNGIEARVQGSRPKPYEVTIQVTPLNDRQWDLVIDALSEQALFTAQLLAGEMPGNIEDAFKTAGVSLFPTQTGDLSSDCTCPDWANPCKHVAATHYILGDRFDDDPFLLFRMRGRTQEEILEGLRQRRSDAGVEEPVVEEEVVETETITPLEETLDHYWEPVDSLDSFPLTIKLASVDMALFKRLGEPAFMGGESLQALLKPFYDVFTRSALRAAYTEEEFSDSNNGSTQNGNGQE